MSKTPFTPEQVFPVREILFIRRRQEDDHFGDSAIVRPDTHRADMSLADVLAVGPDVKSIEPGDKVYLGALAGLKIRELSDSYFLVNQHEILAVIK